MDVGKRLLLKGGVALAALAALPRTLLAAAWPDSAFAATEAGAAMSTLFGTDQATPSDQIDLKVPEIAAQGEGGVMVIPRDQPQSVVAFGQPSILRDDPDYYVAYTVNYILGGGAHLTAVRPWRRAFRRPPGPRRCSPR